MNLIFRMTSVKAKAIETELVIPGNNTRFTYLDISINLMNFIKYKSYITFINITIIFSVPNVQKRVRAQIFKLFLKDLHSKKRKHI